MNAPFEAERQIASRRLSRWALAFVGVLCVGLGGAGVFIPGLPTTIFLIAATWCFTKSCPWLEERLIRNRFFAPFLGYVDRSAPMPRRAKVAAIVMMWTFVTLGIVAIASLDAGLPWLGAPIVGAACIGTVVIVRWDARS